MNNRTKTLLFILILLLVQTFMNNKSFCTTTILGSRGDSKTNTRTIFVCLIQTNGFALFVAKFITARIEAKCIQGFVLCKCAYLKEKENSLIKSYINTTNTIIYDIFHTHCFIQSNIQKAFMKTQGFVS